MVKGISQWQEPDKEKRTLELMQRYEVNRQQQLQRKQQLKILEKNFLAMGNCVDSMGEKTYFLKGKFAIREAEKKGILRRIRKGECQYT